MDSIDKLLMELRLQDYAVSEFVVMNKETADLYWMVKAVKDKAFLVGFRSDDVTSNEDAFAVVDYALWKKTVEVLP